MPRKMQSHTFMKEHREPLQKDEMPSSVAMR
jgi:hypothetical protein